MTRAFFEDGSSVLVQFWVPATTGEANGFGIVDGRMKRLDVLGGFDRFEVV